MVIIGLTGSIGMGKSTVSAMLRRLGVPVNDADAEVHRMLGRGGRAVAPIAAAFPGVVKRGAVDRAALGKQVFGDTAALRRLEGILHPMVGDARDAFLRRWSARRAPLVAIDVPLLFEAEADRLCDATILVTASTFVQAGRVLRRPGMTPRRLAEIRAKQMPEAEKRRRAEFIVPTGLGFDATLRRISGIVRLLQRRRGWHWPPR